MCWEYVNILAYFLPHLSHINIIHTQDITWCRWHLSIFHDNCTHCCWVQHFSYEHSSISDISLYLYIRCNFDFTSGLNFIHPYWLRSFHISISLLNHRMHLFVTSSYSINNKSFSHLRYYTSFYATQQQSTIRMTNNRVERW